MIKKYAFILILVGLYQGAVSAADASRFLKPRAWQCTFEARLNTDVSGIAGPGGMAYDSKREFLQALGKSGVEMDNPGGDTDTYREVKDQSLKGKIRLHYTYDGGPDGIQIAGWDNGEAVVSIKNYFEGTEQKKIIFRDKTTTYNGKVVIRGEEYEPPFQIWISPDEGVYSLEYGLPSVRGSQVEHCRMREEMEADRKKLESASDEDMPLGGFFGGLVQFACPTERKMEVDIDGGVLSALVENVPLPDSTLKLEGKGQDGYSGVSLSWSCVPE